MIENSIKKAIEKIHKQYIEDLTKYIAISSVYENDNSKYPYGKNIQLALEFVMNKAKEFGFKTYMDPNGNYGYVDMGEGKDLVGILCHIDVVPPGNLDNWKTDPFKLTIKDGKAYGRGSQDNKGPGLAILYVAKQLMEQNVKLNSRLRIIFGTDEESLWRGIAEYVKKEEIPSMGFSPDSVFPAIFAEAGLLNYEIYNTPNKDISFSIVGGQAYNTVPDQATYRGNKINELAKELNKLGFDFIEKDKTITVNGKISHASKPEEGINAVSRLCIALNNINETTPLIKFVSDIGEDPNAKLIYKGLKDDLIGDITSNLGMIEINDSKEIAKFDIRMPIIPPGIKDVIGHVVDLTKTKASEYNLKFNEYDRLNPVYVPKDSKLVKTLMEVWKRNTNDNTPPLTSKGATYARAMDNCVAFGYVFPNSPEVEHKDNEYIILDEMYKSMEIFADTIMSLTNATIKK